MPFEFEYLVQIQKFSDGFKLHYVIPKKYFEDKPQTFETFLAKISDKKDENDFSMYKPLFASTDIKSTVEELSKLKCDKLTDESYFLTVKHHIIQEFKQFNRLYYQLKKFNKRLNGEDLYSHVVNECIDVKLGVDNLIKTYKSELEHDFKDLVNFDNYTEANKNINKLHTDILLALKNHEKDYEGVCFDITNCGSANERAVEDTIYYKSIGKLSTRIVSSVSRSNERSEGRKKQTNDDGWRKQSTKPRTKGSMDGQHPRARKYADRKKDDSETESRSGRSANSGTRRSRVPKRFIRKD